VTIAPLKFFSTNQPGILVRADGAQMAMGDSKTCQTKRRIVFTTFGSLGDLYPYIALAREMQERGHEAIIATSRHYRQKIESRGIGFHAIRPDGPDIDADSDMMRRIMDRRKGGEYIIRELLMPVLAESYEDLLTAAEGADLLVSHVLTFTARLVAESKGLPWASTFLQPLGFFSACDPPVLPQLPFLSKLRFLGAPFHRALFGVAERSCRSWSEPWHDLRARVGLPPTSENPLFEGQHSPRLVLALFSEQFARKQPDWPAQTIVSGFPFPDEREAAKISPDLDRSLKAGTAPVVFTLGSSGVVDAGWFFEQSAAAVELLGRRAVLIGKGACQGSASLPDGVMAFDYAPFSELFPRAAAIVHAGGVGTTALAMRAGRPMLVMPCAHDHFDNAARVTRLGIARTISRRQYNPTHVAAELRHLLHTSGYSQRASRIGEQVQRENGVEAACNALEELLPPQPSPGATALPTMCPPA